jgi:hypothetical protein
VNVTCGECDAEYEDEIQLTYCPHEEFGPRKLAVRALLDDPDVHQLIAEGDWESVRALYEKKLQETPKEPLL